MGTNGNTRCLLIHPKFAGSSFWNYRATCELLGAKYPAAPLGMITVAALLPDSWEMRLVDRNVQSLDNSLIDWADIVLIGGMLPQQNDSRKMISLSKSRGKPVVVGGPDCTSSPHLYEEADHRVLGEAEVTLPGFLEDWSRGRAKPLYQSEERADLTRSPIPRFDLLRIRDYLHVGVQWGRGCPFSCEFCDIIELFGRIPRAKTNEQMLAELQRLYDLGYRGHVDFVDDNFVGHKKLVKAFLPRLREWLRERGSPFEFTTEASINLARDDELLRMMKEANFSSVFIGIESPDRETLIKTRKHANLSAPIAEAVHKIHRHGMFVNAGFILGFDTETTGVAEGIIDCVQDAAIPAAMAGLLYALPGTQLTRRLKREGRLADDFELAIDSDAGDQCTGGINFEPLRPRRDIMLDYLKVIETIYEPSRYFDRVLRVGLALNASGKKLKLPLRTRARELRGFFRLICKMGLDPRTRHHFWRVLVRVLLRNPGAMRYTVALCGLYLHFGKFAGHVASRIRAELNGKTGSKTREPSPATRTAPSEPAATAAPPPAATPA